MKRAFLFLAVAILFCNPTLAQEPDPDPNLLWVSDTTWKDGFHRFLVHPNGNILAGIGSTEFELDGNTGKIIREFSYPAVFYDVSPDGKYISALTDQRCVIDYETEEVVERFTTSNTSPKFMPDSKTLIYTDEIQGSGTFKLASFNIETKQHRVSQNYFEKTQIGSPCVSPDGRFVATGGWYYETEDEGDTHLLLWDAHTLEPIRVLGEKKDFNPINSIKFSPDSRLVGFGVYAEHLYVYDTENFSIFKYDDSVFGFGFVTNDYFAIGGGSWKPLIFKIVKLSNGDIIYSKNNFSGNPEYNKTNNSIIVFDGHLYCYDFEKILTGASIESAIPNPFMVEYTSNTLSIRNFTFATNQISCSITDLNGRVIRNLNLNILNNDIRIPIKLISGTYFLHIKDGSKEYVSKFLVTN